MHENILIWNYNEIDPVVEVVRGNTGGWRFSIFFFFLNRYSSFVCCIYRLALHVPLKDRIDWNYIPPLLREHFDRRKYAIKTKDERLWRAQREKRSKLIGNNASYSRFTFIGRDVRWCLRRVHVLCVEERFILPLCVVCLRAANGKRRRPKWLWMRPWDTK